ncbi:PIN domain-containing protein [Corallococcus coralloides]|nr:PIN domain-containing protein [Corallococcus coralloides]
MFPAIFRVFLDANVLYPGSIRNVLLDAHAKGLIQAYWSDQVLEEMRRNLVLNHQKSEVGAAKLVDAIRRIFPGSLVTGYESRVQEMRNDEGDRHVAAAALTASAQVIVTNNLRHFRSEDLPAGIEAQSADEFLQDLLDLDPEVMVEILKDHTSKMKDPKITLEEYLEQFSRSAPGFIRDVREYLHAVN